MLGNIEIKWIYDILALEELRSFTLASGAQKYFSVIFQSQSAGTGVCRRF